MRRRYRQPRETFTIEPGGRGATYAHRDGYTVYKLGTYPRSSVLAGQQSRTFMDRFDTLDAAQAAYPQADLIAGTSYQPPYLGHLSDDGDW